MPRLTIKSLEEQLKCIRDLRDGDIYQCRILKEQASRLTIENEMLRKDKEWLQRMHSAVLQSMHSFVTGKNH